MKSLIHSQRWSLRMDKSIFSHTLRERVIIFYARIRVCLYISISERIPEGIWCINAATAWFKHEFCYLAKNHDDVIKWKHFPRYWPFMRGIHRSPVNSAHKGQWRGALMFSLICVWINGWVNNREAGDLRRYRAHFDVIVMSKHEFCYLAKNVSWFSKEMTVHTAKVSWILNHAFAAISSFPANGVRLGSSVWTIYGGR